MIYFLHQILLSPHPHQITQIRSTCGRKMHTRRHLQDLGVDGVTVMKRVTRITLEGVPYRNLTQGTDCGKNLMQFLGSIRGQGILSS
jgi:hypothetical protein